MHHDQLEGAFRSAEDSRSEKVAHRVKGEFGGTEHADAVHVERN